MKLVVVRCPLAYHTLGYRVDCTVLLVFRRKDLCEAKHDLGVRKICPKSTLYPLCYAFWGGQGLLKHSVVNMNAIVRAKHSILNMNAIVRAKHTKHECYSESKA